MLFSFLMRLKSATLIPSGQHRLYAYKCGWGETAQKHMSKQSECGLVKFRVSLTSTHPQKVSLIMKHMNWKIQNKLPPAKFEKNDILQEQGPRNPRNL